MDLKCKLSQKWLLDGGDIENKFGVLADYLLKHVAIQKGGKEYWMTDIEFYFYSPNHRDFITYPRNCEAGQWYFHPSGVDISFESKVDLRSKSTTQRMAPYLTDTSVFGGILLRRIKLVDKEGTLDDSSLCFKGPMLVCDELFDKFDAFGNVTNFPVLILRDHCTNVKIESEKRVNLVPKDKTNEQKFDSIISYNYSGVDVDKTELYHNFEKYLTSEYRFHL